MKKTLHLVCNAHIDPVWQWNFDEGIAAILATFNCAVELLDKYDYIFCHNEVFVYQCVEKYRPELFKRIQELVKQGRWKIMGGWYIQPDCLVPSGESFIRQIKQGKEYFNEKFQQYPTTAINFDAFGHTRGLPQILKKTGFDSYLFCRPLTFCHVFNKVDPFHGTFAWKGYDGSTVKAFRQESNHIYSTAPGKAKEQILEKIACCNDLDSAPILWGVGNHGGVNSEKDIEDILILKKETADKYEIIHSSLENFFKDAKPTHTYSGQMICFMKSYSSCHNIKLVHDQLENALYVTEKICSLAAMTNNFTYNQEVLKKAEELLCLIEFHDVLSGTAVKSGTDASIAKAHHALDLLKDEYFRAFSFLAESLPRATPNDDSFVLFNPCPYSYDGYVETETYNTLDNLTLSLYDQNHQPIPYQIIKEESDIRLDRRVRFIYKVHLEPFSISAIGVHKEPTTEKIVRKHRFNEDVIYKDKTKQIIINGQTGLIDSFIVDGKQYLNNRSFQPVIFDDNEDPWGWWLNKFTNFKDIPLANKKVDAFQGLETITVLEEGDLLTEVQVLYAYHTSKLVVNYRIYKDVPYFDVNIHVLWNEAKKGLKLKINSPIKGSYFAQMAFGKEKYAANSLEYPCNRYVGVMDKDGKTLSIYNNSGVHSVSKTKDHLYLTLLNGSSYCAHPSGPLGAPILPEPERFTNYIEQGTHDFSFRIRVNEEQETEKYANEFNSPVYSLLYFPYQQQKITLPEIILSNQNIVISALNQLKNHTYLIRLYNGSSQKAETTLTINGVTRKITFKKFEFRTFIIENNTIKESQDAAAY